MMAAITRPGHITAVAETGMDHHRQAAAELVASYRNRLAAGDDKVHASGAVVIACLAVMDPEEAARTLAAAVVLIAELQSHAAHVETELAATRQMLAVATAEPAQEDDDEPFDCAPECRCRRHPVQADRAGVDRHWGPLAATGGES